MKAHDGPAEIENEQHVDAVNDGGHGHETVLAGKGGRKRDQGHEHQEEDVQPDEGRIEPADDAEDRMVHEPEHSEDHEAQDIDEKFGPQLRPVRATVRFPWTIPWPPARRAGGPAGSSRWRKRRRPGLSTARGRSPGLLLFLLPLLPSFSIFLTLAPRASFPGRSQKLQVRWKSRPRARSMRPPPKS